MITTDSPFYRKAFERYLRQGTSIEVSLKAMMKEGAHETAYYIWRTRRDNKVRPSHAANEGRIFSWANPPETGNPGEIFLMFRSAPELTAANAVNIEIQSEKLARIIIGALIERSIVKKENGMRAVEVAAEELLVRWSMESLYQ